MNKQTILYSQTTPRFLWFLILSYTIVLVIANWFDPRLIRIFTLTTDAGTLIFPLTFLLSDLITEVYGYKNARRAIWIGFLFNVIFILYGQLVIHLPSPLYQTYNDAFDKFLAMDARIIFASALSYLSAEPLNSYLLAKLKIKTDGRNMGFRFVASTFFAAGLDSVIFGTIAFYSLISDHNLFILIVTMWFIKVAIEICGLPISLFLAQKLKKAEAMDIYDRHTNFNIFSLNTTYAESDNRQIRC